MLPVLDYFGVLMMSRVQKKSEAGCKKELDGGKNIEAHNHL